MFNMNTISIVINLNKCMSKLCNINLDRSGIATEFATNPIIPIIISSTPSIQKANSTKYSGSFSNVVPFIMSVMLMGVDSFWFTFPVK